MVEFYTDAIATISTTNITNRNQTQPITNHVVKLAHKHITARN